MKAHIASTARALFIAEGFANVSMRRLAKEAGCSPMTIYNYFDGKITVLQTLWTLVFDELFDGLSKEIDNHTDPSERLSVFCFHYTDFWIRHPDHYRLVFMSDGVTQPDVSLFIDNPEIAAHFVKFGHLVSEGLRSANITKDQKLVTDLLLSTMHGIAHNTLTISGFDWSDHRELVDYVIRAILFQTSSILP